MKKVVGGRGEDVGGRLDIGEQLIPLLLLCSSYDWAAWPFLNPQCRFYSPHIKLQLTLTLHNIECNWIECHQLYHLSFVILLLGLNFLSLRCLRCTVSYISYQFFFSYWQAPLTYFSCCYLVNRFGALLSLSICQFPLGGFKVKVLAVHFHITHESFTCMNGHWGLFCSLGTLLSLEDWISDAYQIMIFIYRVIFLTGPPLRMSLDWPPPKMPRLAPPKSCKYENHIKVLRHLDFFWSWGGPVWDSNVFSKSVTYWPTLAPIFDPVNFFSVLTLLADCDRASILSVKVFHFHLVMEKETLIATSLSRLKYGSVAPTLSLLLCPIKCTYADTKHSKVFGCMYFPFKIGMFLVFCKSTSRAASWCESPARFIRIQLYCCVHNAAPATVIQEILP